MAQVRLAHALAQGLAKLVEAHAKGAKVFREGWEMSGSVLANIDTAFLPTCAANKEEAEREIISRKLGNFASTAKT